MNSRFLTKTLIILFCCLCLNICLCVNTKESAAFEKEGQIYLIQSAKDMRTPAQLVNRNEEVEPGVKANIASYRLTRDIDISEYCTGEAGWEPIGYRDNRDDSFEGILWKKVEESGEGEGHWATYEATDAGYFNGAFDGNGYSVPVIGTPNKIQGRNTLEKGLQISSPFLIRKRRRRTRDYDKFNKV